MDFTPEETRTTASRILDTTTRSYDDYNVGVDVGYPESTVKSPDNLRRILTNVGYGETPVFPVDISAEGNPVDVVETGMNRQIMDAYQDQSVNGIYDGTSKGRDMNQFNQHSSEQVLNDVNKLASLQNGNPEQAAAQQAFLPQNIDQNDKNILDIQVQNGGGTNDTSAEDSDIILNIEKIRGRRQVAAEEKIAKLISFCFSDYQCSGMAICIRSNLKQPGYCKCIEGFYGVGIFCREDIGASNNNFGLQDFQQPDEVPYPSSLPIIEETG